MSDSQEKILIIRLSSIGDILLTTPFIRQIRKKFLQSKIDFVIKKEFADLLNHNPNLNNLIKYDSKTGAKGLKELKKSLIEMEDMCIYHYNCKIHCSNTGNNLSDKIQVSRRIYEL